MTWQLGGRSSTWRKGRSRHGSASASSRAATSTSVAFGRSLPRASPRASSCLPKVVVFAILGALSLIPKWYRPQGERSAKEIAEAFSTYLVRGLERQPSADVIPPLPESVPASGAWEMTAEV
jgi:hypothetical protein